MSSAFKAGKILLMKYRNILKLLSLLMLFLISFVSVQSCSTEKDVAINRGFHNMNARYNGYFNAGEIINEALQSYRNKTKEDYTKILPLENYPDKENAVALAPQMEDAIERCSKVIYKHAMPNPNNVKNKDTEYGKWIDNNWFIIGKAHYIKGEYAEAIKIFKFITKFYKGEDGVYLARLWLAKSYMAQGQYSKAKIELDKATLELEEAEENQKTILDIFKKDESTKKMSKRKRKKMRKDKRKNKKNEPAKYTKKLKLDYEKTFAQYYIDTKDYNKAIPHLEKAIELAPNRRERARYRFILAQVYQTMGNSSQAVTNFAKVAKSNAPYEMRFYAKINKALASGGGESLRKDLYKMIKDAKNEEYKDQIYYVLAQMDLKAGQIESAKNNLTKSVLYSINNDRQKAISYLKLADINYEQKNFIDAQKYYDSCVTVLPEDYEDYKQIKLKAEGLADLVENYETYILQDSLQAIALMPEKEREKFLKNTLKQIEEDKARKKREEEQRLLAQQERLNRTTANTGTGSKWYFYNQKAKSRGFNEFRALWGQRALEDDWRRSNKESFIEESEEIITNDSTSVSNELTVDDLRAGLPLTPEALDSSTNLLMNALYNLGIIYKEQLKEPNEAAKYLQKILDKNIPHEKVLPASYQLYLIYKKQGNDTKANKYKQLILQNYPDSDIAKLLIDPDYFKKKEKENRKELEAYENLLRLYNQKRYMDGISKASYVINNQPENEYINKYYLLKAFALSKANFSGPEAVKETLEQLYSKAPDSEEGKVAKMYLDKLAKEESSNLNIKDNNLFTINENEKHYFVLVFPNSEGDINTVKNKISAFNITFFKNDQLKMQNSILDKKNQTIIVMPFENKSKAENYYKAFISQPAKSKLNDIAEKYNTFVISQTNYLTLLQNKNLEEYLIFFKQNY